MTRLDRMALSTVQALAVAMPLLLGGRQPWALTLGGPIALVLLVLTVRERHRRGEPGPGVGVAALAGFAALALMTTVPLPPTLLEIVDPATARLYRDMLPGWPGAAAWTTWRPLALDPYAVWNELGRWSIGAAVFTTLVAFPWQRALPDEGASEAVVARVLLTLLSAATVLAAFALLQQTTGASLLPWVAAAGAPTGRASGPFVNPNHFAAWLEMLLPIAFAASVAVAARLHRRLGATARTARGMGVRPWRTWVSALIIHQRRLWPPVLGATAVVVMLLTHVATGSRGGAAALIAGVGVTVSGMGLRALRRRGFVPPQSTPVMIALALVLASGGALALWARADANATSADPLDVSLASRLAVAAQGMAIVRDHLIFGTGLGSWLHAFRPYQAPPVEGGIWDHAHNDYLELAAETGVAGVALAALFALSVLGAARRACPDGTQARRESHAGGERPPGFQRSEWRAALADRSLVRWGLAGGIAAALVHASVEFALRMPANLLMLMVVTALLVLELRPGPAAHIGSDTLSDGPNARRLQAPSFEDSVLLPAADAALGGFPPSRARGLHLAGAAPAVLLVLLTAAMLPRALNVVLLFAGAAPLSSRDALVLADRTLADGDDTGETAVALVRRAIDRSPADREAHEALANVLGPGADGDAALRRALALEPWSAQVRDALALRLWEEGHRGEALAALEESMARFPYLVSHAYLSPDAELRPTSGPELMRALTEGDTLQLRLSALDDARIAAIERGLARALAATVRSNLRTDIVNDLVTVLEVRQRWAEAAALLQGEAARSIDGRSFFARAAASYLRAHDDTAAERTLLAALLRTPERGDLYRTLAVDVYGARGDFDSASTVLRAGEENALDMRPLYQGITQVLARREAAEAERAP